MGFPLSAIKRAIYFTKNSGLEAASQWIMEHITDPNFSDPFVQPGADCNVTFTPDPNGIEMLTSMGFNVAQATKALKETNNNIERAADWIFSHQNEMDAMELGEEEVAEPKNASHRNGGGSKFVSVCTLNFWRFCIRCAMFQITN